MSTSIRQHWKVPELQTDNKTDNQICNMEYVYIWTYPTLYINVFYNQLNHLCLEKSSYKTYCLLFIDSTYSGIFYVLGVHTKKNGFVYQNVMGFINIKYTKSCWLSKQWNRDQMGFFIIFPCFTGNLSVGHHTLYNVLESVNSSNCITILIDVYNINLV